MINMAKAIKILDKKIPPGKRTQLRLDIAKLHTRTKIEVPVIIERAKKDGPCLLITGGIHGDELNGIEIVRQIISRKYNKPKAGMVICIPVVNIFGFLNQSREFPDGRDLNRVFPGSATGSLASRFAHFLMKEIVPHIDYCIDFHTGGRKRFNAPQIRVGDDEETIKLAEVFNAPFIIKAKHREKSFRDACVKKGKKVLLFEGGKSLTIHREIVEAGVSGALKVMHHLNMRDYTVELERYEALSATKTKLIKKTSWVRAAYSGLFHPAVKTGAYVKKGTVLGVISGPFGDFEIEVITPHSGYIICINLLPIVNQGDALVHITK